MGAWSWEEGAVWMELELAGAGFILITGSKQHNGPASEAGQAGEAFRGSQQPLSCTQIAHRAISHH